MVLDTMQNYELYCSLHPNFKKAFEFIEKAIKEDLPDGRYTLEGTDLYAAIKEYTTKNPADAMPEAHRKYIDIQYVLSGSEMMTLTDISKAVSKIAYNEEKDVELFEDREDAAVALFEAGEYGIFFPNDVHKPSLTYKDTPTTVKKVLVKVKL